MLHVFTAQFSYVGKDRLDVTRKSADFGLVFAPSWPLLKHSLWATKDVARKMAKEAPGSKRWQELKAAEERNWKAYTKAYLSEMSESRRDHRDDWDALLTRESVVLVCYCRDVYRCHRRLLAALLVDLGAVYEGEV